MMTANLNLKALAGLALIFLSVMILAYRWFGGSFVPETDAADVRAYQAAKATYEQKHGKQAVLEAACAALSVKFLADYNISPELGLMLLLMWAFAVALFSDLSWHEIPHELNYILMGTALLLVCLGEGSWFSLLLGTLPAIVLTATAILLFMLRPRNGFGIGGGDIRFVLATGMLMGAGFACAMVFLGSVAVVAGGIGLLVRDLRNGTATPVPMMTGFTAAYLAILFDSYLDTPLAGFLSGFLGIS